jgi:hypothetical protein
LQNFVSFYAAALQNFVAAFFPRSTQRGCRLADLCGYLGDYRGVIHVGANGDQERELYAS